MNGLQALDELPNGSGRGPASAEVGRLRGGAGPAATRAASRQQQVFAVNDKVEVTAPDEPHICASSSSRQ